MSDIPAHLLYTKDHEWVRKKDTPHAAVIGITDFAQASLGDVTYLQLPTPGQSFKKGEILGTVESVKAVSDIYAPLSGKITRINEALTQDPAPVNSDPFGNGWLVEMEGSEETEWKELLDAGAYATLAQ